MMNISEAEQERREHPDVPLLLDEAGEPELIAVVVKVVAAVITGAVDVVFIIVALPVPPCSKTKFVPLIETFWVCKIVWFDWAIERLDKKLAVSEHTMPF
jgi:hypothetical protein